MSTETWKDVELRRRALAGELEDGDDAPLIRLLASDGEAPHDQWVRKRDQRAVLIALYLRGELRVPQGLAITFRCEGCAREVTLKRARRHLVRRAGSRDYLVCQRCADKRRRFERCDHHDDFGHRCSRVARTRGTRCVRHRYGDTEGAAGTTAETTEQEGEWVPVYDELGSPVGRVFRSGAPPPHSLTIAWERLSPLRAELTRAHCAWATAATEHDARPALERLVTAALLYLDECLVLAEEGHLPLTPIMETRGALVETFKLKLPALAATRRVALEKTASGVPRPQLALHGLAREPVLAIRLAFHQEADADFTDDEVEAKKSELEALPEAEKRKLLRECAPRAASR
jgi:hypothetical protein